MGGGYVDQSVSLFLCRVCTVSGRTNRTSQQLEQDRRERERERERQRETERDRERNYDCFLPEINCKVRHPVRGRSRGLSKMIWLQAA